MQTEKLIVECAAHDSLKKKQLEAIWARCFCIPAHRLWQICRFWDSSVVFRLEVLLDNLAAISVQVPVPPAHTAGSYPLAVALALALASSELPSPAHAQRIIFNACS